MPAIRKEELENRDAEIRRLRARIDELELGCGPAPEQKTKTLVEQLRDYATLAIAAAERIEELEQRLTKVQAERDENYRKGLDLMNEVQTMKTNEWRKAKRHELNAALVQESKDLKQQIEDLEDKVEELQQKSDQSKLSSSLQNRIRELEAEVIHLKAQQLTTTIMTENEEMDQQPVATTAAATDILARGTHVKRDTLWHYPVSAMA